jgi:hypothetical protein
VYISNPDTGGKDTLNVVRGFTGTVLDPLTGKVFFENTQFNNQGFLESRRKAIDRARAEFIKHSVADADEYLLVEITEIHDNESQWFVKFDKPFSNDAQIEMLIDVNKDRVLDYKDSLI